MKQYCLFTEHTLNLSLGLALAIVHSVLTS